MTSVDHRRRRIVSFLTLAAEEMKAAETLLDNLPRQGAFFQQRAVEKLLRAVLEAEAIPAGPTWSSAATRFRYPSGSGDTPSVSGSMLKGRQASLVALRQVVGAFISTRTGEKFTP